MADAWPDAAFRGDVPLRKKERTSGEVRSVRLGEKQQSHAVVHSPVDLILPESLQRISAGSPDAGSDLCRRIYGHGRICRGTDLQGLPVQGYA